MIAEVQRKSFPRKVVFDGCWRYESAMIAEVNRTIVARVVNVANEQLEGVLPVLSRSGWTDRAAK